MARLNHPMEICALRLWAPLLIWQCVGTVAAANNEELARDRLDGVESGTLLMRNDDDGYVTTRLLRTAVRMQVTGLINRVTVRQQFRNDTDEWMEAIYVFPLPANAAVDHLHMQIGERIIKGVIKEREAAKKLYSAAKSAGKQVAMVSQERPNMFTTAVANIGPRETISVEIEYQHLIEYNAGRFELRFPLARDRFNLIQFNLIHIHRRCMRNR